MRFINKIQFIVFFIISIDINAQNYPQNLNPHINNINFKNKNYGFEYNAIANLSTSKTFQNIDQRYPCFSLDTYRGRQSLLASGRNLPFALKQNGGQRDAHEERTRTRDLRLQ